LFHTKYTTNKLSYLLTYHLTMPYISGHAQFETFGGPTFVFIRSSLCHCPYKSTWNKYDF